jgi:hypothetical protein
MVGVRLGAMTLERKARTMTDKRETTAAAAGRIYALQCEEGDFVCYGDAADWDDRKCAEICRGLANRGMRLVNDGSGLWVTYAPIERPEQ